MRYASMLPIVMILGVCAATVAACASSAGPATVDAGADSAQAMTTPAPDAGPDTAVADTSVPDTGPACPVDAQGNPTVVCASDHDCSPCDSFHRVCDTTTKRCVPCTSSEQSGCGSSAVCSSGDQCVPACPASCAADDDCSRCGQEAHVCNAGTCAQCSPTDPMPRSPAMRAWRHVRECLRHRWHGYLHDRRELHVLRRREQVSPADQRRRRHVRGHLATGCSDLAQRHPDLARALQATSPTCARAPRTARGSASSTTSERSSATSRASRRSMTRTSSTAWTRARR